MSYSVVPLPFFDRQLKRLTKKYPSLKTEFSTLILLLEQHPATGTPIGNNCYKIRIAIASKNTGKSGGARVISCVQVVNEAVYLLSIYDKSEQENLSDKDLKDLVKQVPE